MWGLSVICSSEPLPAPISIVFMPTKEIASTEFSEATFIEKRPSVPVVVPFWVFFSKTVTPGIGMPS